MTLKKVDLIDRVMNSTGLTRKESTDLVETLLEIIKGTLASGDDLLISGFGKFRVRSKHERIGRNPACPNLQLLAQRNR